MTPGRWRLPRHVPGVLSRPLYRAALVVGLTGFALVYTGRLEGLPPIVVLPIAVAFLTAILFRPAAAAPPEDEPFRLMLTQPTCPDCRQAEPPALWTRCAGCDRPTPPPAVVDLIGVPLAWCRNPECGTCGTPLPPADWSHCARCGGHSPPGAAA